MQLSSKDFDELSRLEVELWQGETRFIRAYMEEVFANDLFEFGRSGRTYQREELLSAQGTEIDARIPLVNLNIRLLSETVAQVTYNSYVTYNGVVEKGRRSSIWSRLGKKWVLRFHQGAPFDL